MNYKIVYSIIISIFICNIIFCGCGSCSQNKVQKVKESTQVANTLVTSIPSDKTINGLIITSCGKCSFGTKERSCSLSAKIGEKVYAIKGTNIHSHGDAHGAEGFCSGVRVAWAKGAIKEEALHVDSFTLVSNK